ncbi:DUF4142 domain-containing protein [Sphingomonas ginkgonis]|nr:DUF4142 domain-containing protein [Sphingomonas ginkgonis]
MIIAIARTTMLAAALGSASAALAAPEKGSQKTRDFVQAAAASDTFEMVESYSALAESRDPQVRSFAEQMLRDHGQTSQRLQQAATSSGLKQPVMQVDGQQSQFLAALQSARGPDFDKTYWRQQAFAHRSALLAQQQYAASGDTPAVRQAAQSAVPLIQSHLAMAEQMSARAGN